MPVVGFQVKGALRLALDASIAIKDEIGQAGLPANTSARAKARISCSDTMFRAIG